MADAPGSGVRLTDMSRLGYLTCVQGQQSRVNQSRKDTGKNWPVDKIGGVICSNIKGPMSPRDRNGNRYLINFVDHSSNYKKYNCRVHVHRTDGGGEYKNVEDFCRVTGVRRQVSEASNQASNGKVERMHRAILNMARCMLFASGLPLKF
ncbi:hypothetical protein PR003_g13736 [Phytophthora rubi]|uniref:Integrase catalytic domain-containing protein n=1 Tax=Phytophthora rubi TaxID=129364 RepID=A0A6A3LF70_9STRA|nr:hypothetical protein PR002_g13320 [Phytophthora rubi]KAE9333996.1 hypothetical protein PR003_g13736 [Phytophthora rubi]